jgi:hypothetical protein
VAVKVLEKHDGHGLGLAVLALGGSLAALFLLAGAAKGLTKKVGDPLDAEVTFTHVGDPSQVWVGVGFSSAGGPIANFIHVDTETQRDDVVKKYAPVKVPAKVPAIDPGVYDIFVWIQYRGGILDPDGKGYLASKLYEKVLEVTA